MRERDFCVFHDPDHAEVVQEARRAGGQRRKKEAAVATAYDFQGLDTIHDIRRLVEVAAIDALSLDNNLSRVRVLGYLAQVACGLLEKGEMEDTGSCAAPATSNANSPNVPSRGAKSETMGMLCFSIESTFL